MLGKLPAQFVAHKKLFRVGAPLSILLSTINNDLISDTVCAAIDIYAFFGITECLKGKIKGRNRLLGPKYMENSF